MLIYVLTETDDTVAGWSSTPGNESEVEIDIPDNHPFLNDIPFIYRLIDGELVKGDDLLLDTVKKSKDRELNEACKAEILSGFTYIIDGTTYWFSYDMEAQGNFRDAKDALEDGITSEILWTVREGGVDGPYARILLDLSIIESMRLVIIQHKMDNISKYRDILMPRVDAATTVEEVLSVKW